MVWHSWGHSGPAAPGEINIGSSVSTGPQFAYFRDWISYTGIATPAYATSSSFPVGTSRTYRFSGAGQLVTGLITAAGSQSFVTPAAGAPSSLNTLDVLTTNLDVVGSPVVTVKVQAPTAQVTQAAGPAGQLASRSPTWVRMERHG